MDVIESTISEQKTFEGVGSFPFVFSPKNVVPSQEQAQKWVKDNKKEIEEKLFQHGAILFRGFGLSSAEHFDTFASSFGGAAPRNRVVGNVFTTNESPPDVEISYHHEMAQVPNWPKKLFFYCQTAPDSGGETPIVVSNEVYRRIAAKFPEFVEKLEKLGNKYIRVMSPTQDSQSPIGRSWKDTFGIDNNKKGETKEGEVEKTKEEIKREAEIKCKELKLEYEWLGDDMKVVNSFPLSPIQVDERSNKKVWFNSIVAAYTQWNDKRNKGETSVIYGNGDYFDHFHIFGSLVVFKWQQGDVLLIDNRQVLHARRPFVPPREIYAWLANN